MGRRGGIPSPAVTLDRVVGGVSLGAAFVYLISALGVRAVPRPAVTPTP